MLYLLDGSMRSNSSTSVERRPADERCDSLSGSFPQSAGTEPLECAHHGHGGLPLDGRPASAGCPATLVEESSKRPTSAQADDTALFCDGSPSIIRDGGAVDVDESVEGRGSPRTVPAV